LRPDGQAEREPESDGGPVVELARGDAVLGLFASLSWSAGGFHSMDLERGEEQRRVEVALLGQAWDVSGDLEGDGFDGEAPRSVR
jgi:hypothetical protein